MIRHVFPANTDPRTLRFIPFWAKVYTAQFRPGPFAPFRCINDGPMSCPSVLDALRAAPVDETVLLTNSDLVPFDDIEAKLSASPHGWAHRVQVDDIETKSNPIVDIGIDAFLLDPKLRTDVLRFMPDMVMGAWLWDAVLSEILLMLRPRHVWTDLVYHERHSSLWIDGFVPRNCIPNKHNRALAVDFFKWRGIDLSKYHLTP